jgi:uncharacterized protein YjbI with pentapeptide repeats
MTGWNFATQNLASANFSSATLTDANMSGANLSSAWLEYADLSGADLSAATMNGATLDNANVAGADFGHATGFGVYQLYSTASYQNKDLHGIGLAGQDLAGAYFSGQNLTGADLSSTILTDADLRGSILREAVLTGANLTRADLRGADLADAVDISSAIRTNTIRADGTVTGLDLGAGEQLTIRYHSVAVHVTDAMAMDASAVLEFVLDDQDPLFSKVTFAPGTDVSLNGILELSFPDYMAESLIGKTFKLFDWSGASRDDSEFAFRYGGTRIAWNWDNLYSNGTVTAGALIPPPELPPQITPEPATLSLLMLGGLALIRRRVQRLSKDH